MSSLQWQSAETAQKNHSVRPVAKNSATDKKSDPWFSIAVGLVGIVIGFLMGS